MHFDPYDEAPMIFISVQFINEFHNVQTATIEVPRTTTIGELSARGYFNIQLV